MAPKEAQLGKRVKLTQVRRPFVFGTTARPFHPQHNPKPDGTPDSHTHSWTAFVRGIDEDVDITYWLRRVQFKLHESIPNPVRMVDGVPGKPFIVHETGWGEFEIIIKLYYPAEAGEKPQTLYHYLKLHPFGRDDAEREAAAADPAGEVRSWSYEEQLFSEPYEAFFRTLTAGAHPKNHPAGLALALADAGLPPPPGGGGGGSSRSKGASKGRPLPPLPDPEAASTVDVWQRTAMIPAGNRPGQPFSRDTEQLELKKLQDALSRVHELQTTDFDRLREREAELERLKAENSAGGDAAAGAGPRPGAGAGAGAGTGVGVVRAGKRGSKQGGL